MKTFIYKTLFFFISIPFLFLGEMILFADEPIRFFGTTDKNPLSYAPNEEMVFSVTLREGTKDAGKPMVGKTLRWERTGDDGVSETGEAISGETPLVIRTQTSGPGFVRVVVRAFETDGTPSSIPEFSGSAGVGWDRLRGLDEPTDFDLFWNRQKERLAEIPIRSEMVSIEVPDDPDHLYFDVKVDCVGAPVSGYYRKPKDAKPKSLPARIAFIGYNHHGAFLPTWGGEFLAVDPHIPLSWDVAVNTPDRLKDSLVFNINAHGFENGQSQGYYDNLAATTLKNYGFIKSENENPETCYFLGMFLRALRALAWLKAQPEWDGRTLIVAGGSQGGLQALAAAGLDSEVSDCYAFIPWLCGLGNGEKRGWVPSSFSPEFTDAFRYFDGANHAKRIKGNVLIVAGLGDYVCPPSGMAVLFNGIKSPKRIDFHQGMQHPIPMADAQIWSFSNGLDNKENKKFNADLYKIYLH